MFMGRDLDGRTARLVHTVMVIGDTVIRSPGAESLLVHRRPDRRPPLQGIRDYRLLASQDGIWPPEHGQPASERSRRELPAGVVPAEGVLGAAARQVLGDHGEALLE